jgi:hypothetical protein
MGITQSRPAATEEFVAEKLTERLRALQLKNKRELVEGDYVYINDARTWPGVDRVLAQLTDGF